MTAQEGPVTLQLVSVASRLKHLLRSCVPIYGILSIAAALLFPGPAPCWGAGPSPLGQGYGSPLPPRRAPRRGRGAPFPGAQGTPPGGREAPPLLFYSAGAGRPSPGALSAPPGGSGTPSGGREAPIQWAQGAPPGGAECPPPQALSAPPGSAERPFLGAQGAPYRGAGRPSLGRRAPHSSPRCTSPGGA